MFGDGAPLRLGRDEGRRGDAMVGWLRQGLLAVGVTLVVLFPLLVAGSSAPADAQASSWYASTAGTSSDSCTQADPCDLQTALDDAAAGGTVDLVTPNDEGTYGGGFTLDATGSVAIDADTGGDQPYLSGSGENASVLRISGSGSVQLTGPLTIEDAQLETVSGGAPAGGGIDDQGGGSLTVTASNFDDNDVGDDNDNENASGGAIAMTGAGSLTINSGTTGSTFDHNQAYDYNSGNDLDAGGAIAMLGSGMLTIDAGGSGPGTTFSDNIVSSDGSPGSGGAIYTASTDDGTLTIGPGPGTAFNDNSADADGGNQGGAITAGLNADQNINVENATFTDNDTGEGNGGAVYLGSGDEQPASFIGDSFTKNEADGVGPEAGGDATDGNGGAIDHGDHGTDTSSTNDLEVSNSTFTGNTAHWDGGAIDNADGGGDDGNDGYGSGDLTAQYDDFNGNTSSYNGGAIANGVDSNGGSSGVATATISQSLFVDDTATFGQGGAVEEGGYDGTGSATISQSTFSGNHSGTKGCSSCGGGAIANADTHGESTTSVTYATFAGNTAHSGGTDVDQSSAASGAGTTVAADIFSSGSSCDQGTGVWNDQGYNMGTDDSCFGASPGAGDTTDASLASQLGPLTDNGGPTDTMALLSDNPAILAVPLSDQELCPVTSTNPDQRGDVSGSGESCDAGAVQLLNTTTDLTTSTSSVNFGSPVTLTATVSPSTASSEDVTLTDTANGNESILTTVPLSSGTATWTGDLPAVGDNVITASYPGDANYTSSSSTQTVDVTSSPGTGVRFVDPLLRTLIELVRRFL
jgi:hypothetical protein